MIFKIKSLLSREDGTAGIEFALLGFPFIVLILGILETSLYFASGVILEGATADAARMIRTGQIREDTGGGGIVIIGEDGITLEDEGGRGGRAAQAFERALCFKIAPFLSCREVRYEAMQVPDNDFANAAGVISRSNFDIEGYLEPQGFEIGAANDVVLIRVFYRYRFMIPLIESMMQNSEGRSGDLMSIAIIRNEPYDDGA